MMPRQIYMRHIAEKSDRIEVIVRLHSSQGYHNMLKIAAVAALCHQDKIIHNLFAYLKIKNYSKNGRIF